MRYSVYKIDAFIRQSVNGFSGNPAAIVPLEEWLNEEQMQAIAAENNLSETAFFVKNSDGIYHIRWFTPTTEVDLCGHATLAAAWVIRNELQDLREIIPFSTQEAGNLTVRALRSNGGDNTVLQLDFPARPGEMINNPLLQQQLEQALGQKVVAICNARDMLVELESEQALRNCRPNQALLSQLETFAVMVTARSDSEGYDFVSRFFAPRQGLDEDPVTGSSFCTLTPYWSEKLGKTQLNGWQCSARGGDAMLQLEHDRVLIAGRCFAYMKGEFCLPDETA
ncbi:PhzF family phenazine biosynthesis protein [Thalassolituus sp. C2-1]|uniref:PhzF family phenazine biosynthesis protein n=1 Tax=Venatorbacter sp. C2-1 TaxID=2597518 RepID=UPI00118F6EAD|nr:PhzF family phenazine biosynthesis protein [Thalassolituus sp. C2-1]TVV45515.1 PhzF family phenazine biosynthesis protein [Thalassolituus sp. C2-1]